MGTFVGTLRAVLPFVAVLCAIGRPRRDPRRAESCRCNRRLANGTGKSPFSCPCADRAFRRRGGGGRGDAADGRRRSPCSLRLEPHRRRLQAQCPGDCLKRSQGSPLQRSFSCLLYEPQGPTARPSTRPGRDRGVSRALHYHKALCSSRNHPLLAATAALWLEARFCSCVAAARPLGCALVRQPGACTGTAFSR